ncbi:sulfotransferase [Planktomarina temperata]|nr:sulfotransferase [Planktomarina temperata]
MKNSEEELKFIFIIGPQRTGTTWLYDTFCRQGSGFYIDRLEKENYFFSKRLSKNKHRNKLRFLKRLFGNGKPRYCVDVCSTYFGDRRAIENIVSIFPEANFIFIRRADEDRQRSYIAHSKYNRLSNSLIGYEISSQLYNIQSEYDSFVCWMQEFIGSEKILELNFSDLEVDNGKIWIMKLSEFLGGDLDWNVTGKSNSSRRHHSPLTEVLLFCYRFMQFLRIHIFLRKIRLIGKYKANIYQYEKSKDNI